MTDMVERVARAIYEGRNGTGCKAWARLPKSHQQPYILDALNALHELREPTNLMAMYGGAVMGDSIGEVTNDDCAAIFTAMIDAALQEEGE